MQDEYKALSQWRICSDDVRPILLLPNIHCCFLHNGKKSRPPPMGNRDFHYLYDKTNNSLFYRNKSQGCTLYVDYFHTGGPYLAVIYKVCWAYTCSTTPHIKNKKSKTPFIRFLHVIFLIVLFRYYFIIVSIPIAELFSPY